MHINLTFTFIDDIVCGAKNCLIMLITNCLESVVMEIQLEQNRLGKHNFLTRPFTIVSIESGQVKFLINQGVYYFILDF